MGKVITLSGMRMGLANPATENCAALGGTWEKVEAEDGSEYGLCTLPDGTLCEEWALYRGECGPADIAPVEPVEEPTEGSKLLNYGIAMGAGALVGIMVGVSMKKPRGSKALIGAGVGAALGAVVLAMTWPKKELPPA